MIDFFGMIYTPEWDKYSRSVALILSVCSFESIPGFPGGSTSTQLTCAVTEGQFLGTIVGFSKWTRSERTTGRHHHPWREMPYDGL